MEVNLKGLEFWWAPTRLEHLRKGLGIELNDGSKRFGLKSVFKVVEL